MYVTPEIEEHFGHGFYLELVSLDFKGKYIYLDLIGELEYPVGKN